MSELLLEIGLEEVPAVVLPSIREQIGEHLRQRLSGEHLRCETVAVLYTLRRIVVRLTGLDSKQDDREEVVLGPPRSVALDPSGAPTKAAAGFARSRGVSLDQCTAITTEKGEYFGFTRRIEGRPATEILPKLLGDTLEALTFPKAMRWGDGAFVFVRPVRWILAVLDGSVLPFSFAGATSSNTTRLDRFTSTADVRVAGWGDYCDQLRTAGIQLDPEVRRREISEQLAIAAASAGGRLRSDHDLLETVADLVESPRVVSGRFAEDFLELPQEILVTSMREHQKHFSVLDEAGSLLPCFLTVAEAAGMSLEAGELDEIRHGNERVLRARLEDARFYWRDDAKRALAERAEQLDHVLFHQGLGSYRDKCDRILQLLPALARHLPAIELDALTHAASLSKADLTTDMVKEFTSLQGIVGGLYARREGLPEKVWRAIYEHYLPISIDERLPATDEGCLLSVADRLDTISGCIGLGDVPTGSRDPFGLRRLAQGVVRICAERGWVMPLRDAFNSALDAYGTRFDRPRSEILSDLNELIDGRLRSVFEGYGYDLLNSVMIDEGRDPADIERRLDALNHVIGSPDFRSVAVAFKRIKNIVREQPPCAVSPDLYRQEEERELDRAFREVERRVDPMIRSREYEKVLLEIAALRSVVDRYFDTVLVMDSDPLVRANRIGLLQQITGLFLRIADFSEIDVEKRSQ